MVEIKGDAKCPGFVVQCIDPVKELVDVQPFSVQ